jgi:hypothetical protein
MRAWGDIHEEIDISDLAQVGNPPVSVVRLNANKETNRGTIGIGCHTQVYEHSTDCRRKSQIQNHWKIRLLEDSSAQHNVDGTLRQHVKPVIWRYINRC